MKPKLNHLGFLNKHCKSDEHSLCHACWEGIGYEVRCECKCHKKSKAADGFTRPLSVEQKSQELCDSR